MTTVKRVTRSPLSVQVHLTRRCNMNCVYCGADEFRVKEKEPELDTNEWIALIKRLKDIGVFSLDISGGEIFLREDIFDILETAVNCKFPKIRLTTNGTLVNEEIAKHLDALNFQDVSVSLDGNKETNDYSRGEGSFEKIVEGIRNLIGNKIIPSIRFTTLKSNYQKIGEMATILYSLGIRSIVFNQLKATGSCRKIFREIMLDFFSDTEELQDIIDNIRQKHADLKIPNTSKFYRNLPVQFNTNRPSIKSMNNQNILPCSAGHSSCNISSGGWVLPCSELFDFKGGNIRERDILDIWRNSENFEKIRSLPKISMRQIPYCRNCNYNVFCSGGCRADAYSVYGDLMAPDPFCPYWREK